MLKRNLCNYLQKILIGFFVSLPCLAQTQLETFFRPEELSMLEQLIRTAQMHDAKVMDAELAVDLAESETELPARLKDALSIQTGLSLSGDIYGQASPGYSISVSLDVVSLIPDFSPVKALTAELQEALASKRVATVEAYVGFKISRQKAENASLALTSAEAVFDATLARLEMGEATPTDLLRARSNLADIAVALLEANAAAIVSLEHLAATLGVTPAELVTRLDQAEMTNP